MNKKILFFLLALIIFLIWFFTALFFTTEEDWWTVIYLEQESYDIFIARISFLRVLIGAIVSILISLITYKVFSKTIKN